MYVVQEFLVDEEKKYVNETYFDNMETALRFRNLINKHDVILNAKTMMICFDSNGTISLEEILL